MTNPPTSNNSPSPTTTKTPTPSTPATLYKSTAAAAPNKTPSLSSNPTPLWKSPLYSSYNYLIRANTKGTTSSIGSSSRLLRSMTTMCRGIAWRRCLKMVGSMRSLRICNSSLSIRNWFRVRRISWGSCLGRLALILCRGNLLPMYRCLWISLNPARC